MTRAARLPARRAGARRRPRTRASRDRLVVRVTDARGRPTPLGRGLGAWLVRAAPRGARGVVSIALVSDASMRRLNRQYRGVDRTTDVLSFAEGGSRSRAPRPRRRMPGVDRGAFAVAGRPGGWGLGPEVHLGDLAIARGVAGRQARNLGHSAATELRLLALHGLLHLLGYDHEADQGEMGRLEDRLRRRAGLPSALIARTVRSATRR